MATLEPLATGADLEARGITLDDTSPTFLKVASAAVRDAAGCPISEYTGTIKLLGNYTCELALPGPVTDVSEVTIDGLTVTGWVLRQDRLYRLPGWWNPGSLWVAEVAVTLTFGLAVVPDDIVDLVCSIAAAGMAASLEEALGRDPRATAEQIDDYRVQWAQGAGALQAAAAITPATREWLRGRFGTGVEVSG